MHKRVQQAVNILQDILAGDGEVDVEEALTVTLELLKPVPEAIGKAVRTLNSILFEDELPWRVEENVRNAIRYIDVRKD